MCLIHQQDAASVPPPAAPFPLPNINMEAVLGVVAVSDQEMVSAANTGSIYIHGVHSRPSNPMLP